MDLSNFWWQAAAAGPGPGPSIGNSLRFRGAQYLRRAVSTSSNVKKITFSQWFKRSKTGRESLCGSFSGYYLVQFFSTDGTRDDELYFGSDYNGSTYFAASTQAQLRDPSAWYHLVGVMDSTLPTETDRLKIYLNGERQSIDGSSFNGMPTLNADILFFNAGGQTYDFATGRPFEGYMADVHFIDGQALEPTAFGNYDANGVWMPKEYTGTYGTNGFMLDFSDPADIGADRSGNGNDWTATGFELADQTSVNWDHMEDSPTQNYATLNPLFNNGPTGSGNYSNANLGHTGPATGLYKTAPGGMTVRNGAYYWEVTLGAVSNINNSAIGITRGTNPSDSTYVGYDTNGNVYGFGYNNYYAGQGAIIGDLSGEGAIDGAPALPGSTGLPGYFEGDVIGIRCDVPNNSIAWYLNDVFVFEVTNLNSEYDWMPAQSISNIAVVNFVNFGQQEFKYAVPAGFKSLQSANLPTAAIANGRDHFQAITDTGANILTAAQTAFPNSLIWIKDRVNSNQHQLIFNDVNNFAFTCPTTGRSPYAAPSGDSVAWCWNLANPPESGCYVITDTSSYINNQLFNHPLGSEPEFIIYMSGGSGQYHPVYHKDTTGWLRLDDSSAQNGNKADLFPTVTSTQIGLNTLANTSTGEPIAAALFKSVPGYSAFGSFSGNASADGPFVALSFRPAWIMFKAINQNNSWQIIDATRDPVNNGTSSVLQPDRDNAENINMLDSVDILSNGFKIRDSGGFNGSGWKIMYAAFAENPFGGSNVLPANAR